MPNQKTGENDRLACWQFGTVVATGASADSLNPLCHGDGPFGTFEKPRALGVLRVIT